MRSIEDLHDYQLRGVAHIRDNPSAALLLEMGLGKTVTTLTAFCDLQIDLDVSRALVIAPKRVVETVWHAEADNWAHLNRLRVVRVLGTAEQRLVALHRDADLHIISRDNLVWLLDALRGKRLFWDMLIIDELSSFKNPSSKRFKALRKLRPLFKRVVGLTGTPTPNSYADLWPQIYLLDRGQRLGATLTAFRNTYLIPDKRNGAIIYSYKLQRGAEERIQSAIADIAISMRSADYLQLPERIINFVRVELPPVAMRQYTQLERELVLSLCGSEISAVNAAALTGKLLQAAGGMVYDSDGVARELHTAKLDALRDILEMCDTPVLCAWAYRHERDTVMRELADYEPVELTGAETVESWNRGRIRLLLMHPASGGHGLNLQAGGATIVWYGHTWSLELEQQLNARLHRQGQTRPVIIHKIIASGTVDEDVADAIARKAAGQDALMEAVKARAQKYLQNNAK